MVLKRMRSSLKGLHTGQNANNGKWEGTYAVHITCSHSVTPRTAGRSYHFKGQHHNPCNWYQLNWDPQIKWSR